MKKTFYSLTSTICLIFALCIPIFSSAQSEIFTTSGTFTVPEGVTSVTVEAWGGGGSGSTISGVLAGGGGGGGAFARKVVAVTPLANYTVNVGVGATGSAAGGDSWFLDASTVLAKGGSSAADDSATGAAGGQASLSIGDLVFNGGNGASGTGSSAGGGGSSAGSAAAGTGASGSAGGLPPSEGGLGGDGRTETSGPGVSGTFPGGGGGGAYRTDGGIAVGGQGGSGLVRITWIGAEINVFGNDIAINNGDTETSATNWTAFEATAVNLQSTRTYQIQSAGTASLSLVLSTIEISGDHAADFAVISAPSGTVNPGGSSFFTVSFTPSELGARTAMISIPNNDNDENPFTFAISGVGLAEDIDGDGFAADVDCDDNNPDVWQNLEFYVDADGDGYGAGELTLACAGDPGVAPAGYSLTSDDCNDADEMSYPGANEIDFNGLDDNCDGTIDEGSQLLSEVLPSQCGTTLGTISSLVGAVSFGAPVDGYRFKVVNTTTLDEQTIDRDVPNFQLTALDSYEYATTYSISVMLRRNGSWLNYYGPSCEVSTPAILDAGGAAAITPAQCGATLPTISTLIATTSLPGVTGYRFRVTNLTDATAPNQVQTIDRSVHWFALTMLDSFTYGTSYSVEVAVKTNGDFSGFGAPCTVTTPAVPAIVNPGVASNDASLFYTTSLNRVTMYRFELTNLDSESTTTVIDRQSHYFSFKQMSDFMPGAQYSVRVAVMTSGTWSLYGGAQTITAPASARGSVKGDIESEPAITFRAVAYPNPYSEGFSLDMDVAGDDNVRVKTYDMTGKLLEEREYAVDQIEMQQFGENYPSGVYNVIVTQGSSVKTMRVIKR